MTYKIEPLRVTVAPEWLGGNPQILAMLQAQNSRTLESIESRTEGAIENPEKLMSSLEKWYLNYNHRSIGQCGMATVFLEGVSLEVAPYLQSSPLYVGQECSTRYIDFGDRGFSEFAINGDMEEHEKQMGVYRDILEKAMTYFGGMSDNKAAIKARAFDFARMALPLSCATNLSITLNFDEWDKHLNWLHGLEYESQSIAIQIRGELHSRFPSVMSKDFGETINPKFELPLQELTVCGMLEETPFPYFQTSIVTDYGSFRDIQRHRPLNPRIANMGYSHFFAENQELYETVTGSRYDFAMDNSVDTLGSQANVEVSGLAPYLKYFVDMRFRETVHPTVSVAVVDIIQNLVGDGGMNVYRDLIDALGMEGSNFDAAITHLSEKHTDMGWEDLKKHCLNSLISMPSMKRAKAEGVAQ